MQGRNPCFFLPCALLPVLTFLAGCAPSPQAAPATPLSQPSSPSEFDPSVAGTIRGAVVWDGGLPTSAPFALHSPPIPSEVMPSSRSRENPNAPVINPLNSGVGNAVVFLRGVDPRKARPWDHPPVRVEQRDLRFHVLQGEVDSHYGFVRRGDGVEMVSKEPLFHSLHAGGAAFFTVPFPDPDRPCSRPLKEKGVVELTSAAGYYWMRAYLFVDDHPYYTRTDGQGKFVLPQVPPGRYEVVCWLPSWIEDHHDRDPEWAYITRLSFTKPAEKSTMVLVNPRETQEVSFTMSREAFSP